MRPAYHPERRMKLLYTNFHSGSGGGHTTYIRELARGLSVRHEVHVAAPEGSRLLREAREIPGLHAFAQAYPNGLRLRPAGFFLALHLALRTDNFLGHSLGQGAVFAGEVEDGSLVEF